MASTFTFIGNQITIYVATPIFIAGVIGGLLNTLVFLSLRTFRQNSCAFYLMIMSMFSVSSLFLGIFARITLAILGVDGTETSLFYCKAKPYLNQVSNGTALACLCLATIDQYFATCSRVRWQQWCNIKLARRLIIASSIIWILHGIPYLVLYDHVISSSTHKVTCISTNYIFSQYRAFFNLLVQFGYLPVIIATLFGWMAYRNVQQMAYRTIPLVRRELDKQLTIMVLLQVVVSIFTLLPYTTTNAVATNPNLNTSSLIQAKVQLAVTVFVILYYATFSIPFYIYIFVSERFRKQLIYVLFTIHLNRWKRPRMRLNQIAPMK